MKVFSIHHHIQAWSWFLKIVFYTALITGCYLAFSPVESGIQTQFNDKLLHFIGFFLMALMAQLAHPNTNFWILTLGLAAFGLTIELVQEFLPYRSFSMWDWAADILGVCLYFMFLGRLLKDKSVPG